MSWFNSFFTQEIAIDLGTANTLIIHNDKVVVDEPSIVAVDRTSGRVIAIGRQAQQMHGKTHENIKTVRLLRDGAIADFVAEEMIKGTMDDQPGAHAEPAHGDLHPQASPKWRRSRS